jgi:hypothetical protein
VATGAVEDVGVGTEVSLDEGQVGIFAISVGDLGVPGIVVAGLESRQAVVPFGTVALYCSPPLRYVAEYVSARKSRTI